MDDKQQSAPSHARLALVTGGTGGIGTAICQALATAGVQVVAGYYNQGDPAKAQAWQQAQDQLGYRFHIEYVDVVDEASCQRCVLNIQEVYGPIAILINNAGIAQDALLQNMAKEHWRSVLETNLGGVFNLSRLVLPNMVAAQWGRIINIASVNAQCGQFGQTNYAAAKAGMHGFTKSLALEVARKGVTVNTVSPGYTATSMVATLPQAIQEKIIAQIPVGRLGLPEEIGRAVAFLADNDASFITGSNLSVNGGQHMY